MKLTVKINDCDEMLGARDRAVNILHWIAQDLDNAPRAGVAKVVGCVRDANENVIGNYTFSDEEH